jgi:hypothetical protein
MYLIGENASPVTATVSIFQRGASGASDSLLPASLVLDEALYWEVGEYGSAKAVSVNLPALVRLRRLSARFIAFFLAQLPECAAQIEARALELESFAGRKA